MSWLSSWTVFGNPRWSEDERNSLHVGFTLCEFGKEESRVGHCLGESWLIKDDTYGSERKREPSHNYAKAIGRKPRLSQANWDIWKPTRNGDSLATRFSMRDSRTLRRKTLKRGYGKYWRALLVTILTWTGPASEGGLTRDMPSSFWISTNILLQNTGFGWTGANPLNDPVWISTTGF